MTTLAAAVASMAALAAAGALPVLVLVGPRWPAVPLAPLAGAVIAAVAGACCFVIGGSTLPWFVVLALAAAAVAVGGRLARSPGRHSASRHPGRGGVGLTIAGTVVVVGTVAWCLLPLRVPSTGWDARAIWLMRASWFAAGHGAVSAAFRNPILSLAHASYPPLLSATVAVSWQLTGNHTDRLGVVVTSLLNGCAVAAAAWVLVEAGRPRTGTASRGARTPAVVGVVTAGLFVLATFGVFGPFATNGYADPLWAAAAVGAIGYGLVLPATRSNTAIACVLVAVAGLTKVEGTATAMALVVLLVARAVVGEWRRRPRSDDPPLVVARDVGLRPVVAGLAGIAALAVWPVLTRLEHTTPDVNTSGTRKGETIAKTHLTVDAMAPHLHVLLLAAPLALVGGVLLATARRSSGLANDLWAWAGLGVGLVIVGAAYVTGPGNIEFWLATSVHRTTMFPAVAAWMIVAVWAVVAARSTRPDAVSSSAEP